MGPQTARNLLPRSHLRFKCLYPHVQRKSLLVTASPSLQKGAYSFLANQLVLETVAIQGPDAGFTAWHHIESQHPSQYDHWRSNASVRNIYDNTQNQKQGLWPKRRVCKDTSHPDISIAPTDNCMTTCVIVEKKKSQRHPSCIPLPLLHEQ